MKDFFIKKLIKSQAPDISENDVDRMFEIFNQNPELFKKIAAEIKEKTVEGKNQMSATLEVMEKYKGEISAIKEK